MGERNKMKNTNSHKKEGGKFNSKNIKHDPNAESTRAVFIQNKSNP